MAIGATQAKFASKCLYFKFIISIHQSNAGINYLLRKLNWCGHLFSVILLCDHYCSVRFKKVAPMNKIRSRDLSIFLNSWSIQLCSISWSHPNTETSRYFGKLCILGWQKVNVPRPTVDFHPYCASITVYSGGELHEPFIIKYMFGWHPVCKPIKTHASCLHCTVNVKPLWRSEYIQWIDTTARLSNTNKPIWKRCLVDISFANQLKLLRHV